jgi:hypothetical protein
VLRLGHASLHHVQLALLRRNMRTILFNLYVVVRKKTNVKTLCLLATKSQQTDLKETFDFVVAETSQRRMHGSRQYGAGAIHKKHLCRRFGDYEQCACVLKALVR